MTAAVTFDVHSAVGTEWSLLRLLALLADAVGDLTWWVSDLDFSPSPAAERAEALLRDGRGTTALLSALAMDPQLVDGALDGRDRTGATQVRIVAVDGQHWDVHTSRPAVLDALRTAIEVSDLPA